jgi:hypothetical protein
LSEIKRIPRNQAPTQVVLVRLEMSRRQAFEHTNTLLVDAR